MEAPTGLLIRVIVDRSLFVILSVVQYELLFCVEDDSDSAIMIVNSLIEKYQKCNAQLFVGKKTILILNINSVSIISKDELRSASFYTYTIEHNCTLTSLIVATPSNRK